MDSLQLQIQSVRAIVVTWNPGPWLERCLGSLTREGLGRDQIWIVDHGTTDGSLQAGIRSFFGIHLITHPVNRSYGEAVNLAASQCGGDVLLIVNPDTELRDGCLRALLVPLQSDPMVAATGPRLINEAGRDVTRFSRTRFSQAIAAVVAPGMFSGWRNRLSIRKRSSGEAVSTSFIEGSVMLMRRNAYNAVGGFDPQFTFYGEDADLCWSLRRCGYRLVHVPSAAAVHAGSTAFSTMPERQRQAFLDGIMLGVWKRSGRRYRWKRLAMFAFLVLAWLRVSVRVSSRRNEFRALLKRLSSEAYLPPRARAAENSPSLTVVIPTVARPLRLEALLEALGEQDDPDFDVVVVIQGSKTGYEAVLEKRHDSFNVQTITLPLQSRGAAKNAGARASGSEIVLFLDDDILPPRDLISAHRRAYSDPRCGAASCRVVEEGTNEPTDDDRLRLTWYGRIVANTASRRTGWAEAAACGNMSFRRQALLTFGGFDAGMRGTANLEEFDVSERIRSEGWRIWFDGSTTIRHFPQPGGNADAESRDVESYYRDLHHNLALIYRRHRSIIQIPLAGCWAAGRSIRKGIEHRLSLRSVARIWRGFTEGLISYRQDQI